jgi:hypothetical protein
MIFPPWIAVNRERSPGGKVPMEQECAGCVWLPTKRSFAMNNIIYIVGLVVVVLAVLSFFGLR